MIQRAALQERVSQWGLTEAVVEKDYILGWLLSGIGAHPVLARTWVFKCGTCLKKCYVETHRFSEDLDFSRRRGDPSVALAMIRDANRRSMTGSGDTTA